jgi:uncharacterized membrane protein YjgN (DUF898 family)
MDDHSARPEAFKFSGDSLEYFRIWIVNLLLTIVTLGIYSAWAKVRTKRYFYGNTHIHGSAFNYTADPVKILKGRILAVVLLIIYQVCFYFYPTVAGYLFVFFLLFLPLVYVMNMAFRMRYTTWRGINFSFSRDYGAAYLLFSPLILYIAVLTLTPLILGVSEDILLDQTEIPQELPPELAIYAFIIGALALLVLCLFPMWQKFYYRFIGNRINYGSAEFSFSVTAWKFYKMYLMAFLIAIVGLILYFAILAFGFDSFSVEPTDAGTNDVTIDFQANTILLTLAPFFLLLLPYLLAFSYIRTRLTNIIYSHIELDNIAFNSTLRFSMMTYLYITNTLAILFTLGLAIPWTMIRMARYRADNMFVLAENFEEFAAQRSDDINAGADAISDIFDLDIGL